MNYNRVILAGTLTRDPETKFTAKGSAVAKLGLAINRNYSTEAGEKKEEVTFVDITAFGKQAETVAQYFKKGSRIHIEGRLKTDSWDDKATGQKRSKLCVMLEGFQFVDRKSEALSEPRAAAPKPATAPKDDDGSVPF